MTNKQKHLDFLNAKGPFQVDCSTAIFSNEELQVLRKYGHWFKALVDGELEPYTDKQRRFVEVMQHKKQPFSIEEVAFWRYRGRKQLEEKDPNLGKRNYTIKGDGFFEREDYYRMHPDRRRR